MELAPLEVALETVETKNSEISSLIDEFTSPGGSTKDINPLSMLLNGVVDAAVHGGTDQFKKVCHIEHLYMYNTVHMYIRIHMYTHAHTYARAHTHTTSYTMCVCTTHTHTHTRTLYREH